MKIRPLRAEMFFADRQTDIHDEANSCFRNFANAPNNTNFAKRLFWCEDYTYCLLVCDTVYSGTSMDISCHPLKIGALPLPNHML
jgi:hypothetical protein